jgi:catecholate siderophore receptor
VALGTEWAEEATHTQSYVVAGLGLTTGLGPVVTGSNGCTAANVGAASGYNCTTLTDPNPYDPWAGTVTRSPTFTETRVTTRALFGFDTIEFNEHWLLNLGVRYDDYTNRFTGGTTANGVFTPSVPLTNNSSFWNYQLGLVYKPVEEASLYVSYGTSSNPSGEGAGDSSSVATTTVNLDPEENKSYEAGGKWNALGGKLNLTAAIFRTDKTNARVTDAEGIINLVGNSRVQGVEVGVGGQITQAWSMTAGYTYTDSEVIDAGKVNTGTTAAPIWTTSPNNGKAFPNTPKHAFSGWTSYRILPAITVGGGASYMSMRYANAANTYSVPSYWRFDAMASWKLNDHVDLQLNLQNLSDERYAVKPYTTHMVQIAEGRTALFKINVKY